MTSILSIPLYLCRWYFGDTKRPEAERLLLLRGNGHGSFLIRNHDSKGTGIGIDWYALSIRDGDIIKHYKIKTTDQGNYFIARRQEFVNLQELVQHYSESQDGLVTCLRNPCLKVEPCRFFAKTLNKLFYLKLRI